MRPIRSYASMSPARVRRRREYRAYIKSAAWYERRRHWHEVYKVEQWGSGPFYCPGGCGRIVGLDDDMHHLSYAALGQESPEHLLALCRGCHQYVHQVIDSSSGWAGTALDVATFTILQRLHEHYDQQRNEQHD